MGYLLLTTGMRASELLSIKFNDICYSSDPYVDLKGKRGKWRRVFISSKSLHLIKHLEELLRIEGYENTFICFNLSSSNKAISYESLRLITYAAVEISNKNKTSPHWFRRSFITKCLSQGVPLFNVMKAVGHESISTTNKYLQDISEFNSVFDVYK